MFDRRPLRDIGANFGEDGLGGESFNAINLHQVDPTEVIQIGPQLKLRFILAGFAALGRDLGGLGPASLGG